MANIGYRTFDGTSGDQLLVNIGNLASTSLTPRTWIVAARVVVPGEIVTSQDYGAMDWFVDVDRYLRWYDGTSASPDASPTIPGSTVDFIAAFRLPTGTGVMRYSLATHNGSVWSSFTHADSTWDPGNPTLPSSGVLHIAAGMAEAFMTGRMAVLATCNAILSDANVNTLTADFASWSALPSITNLWRLDQTPVVDLIGTASQNTLAGTTVTANGFPLDEGSAGTNLVVADGLHAHAADAVVLTQVHSLVVADGLHAHAADNVVLTFPAIDLVVAEARHTHTADQLDLITPAFPIVVGVAESSVNTAGTSHAVTLPASIASTDLVLITMDIGSTSATLNALTDWGEVLDESSANGLKILRYTGAGVPSTPTFTSSASTRSASIAWRISGVNKSITPQIGTTATGTSTAPNPPSVTPTSGIVKDYLFIAFYGAAGEEADDDTWSDTPPTNYGPTPPYQKSCGTAGTNLGGLIAAAWRWLSTGSAEDPGAFAMDVSAAWRAQTIIIHPAVPALVIQEGTHPHSADNLVLTQVHSLVVADATHSHAADNVVLTFPSANLVVQDGAHGHAADNLTLTQVHSLVVADARSTHTADNVVVTTTPPAYLYDDFPGTSIDPTKWVVFDRIGDLANSEVDCVVPENVRVASGLMQIDSKFEDATCSDSMPSGQDDGPVDMEYTTGQVQQAAPAFLYGTVDVRAKIPGGTGTWPCIWMLGYEWQASHPYTANTPEHDWPNDGWCEIDIAEFMGGSRTQQNCKSHFNGSYGTDQTIPFNATTRFMVYRLVWEEDLLRWYIDAEDGNGFVLLQTLTDSQVPNVPMFLIIHTAIGGFGGTPNSSTFPVTFEVDYVRILSDTGNLIVSEGTHVHTADNVVLTQVHSLVVAEARSTHTADALTLTQVHSLVVAEARSTHAADNVTLTQVHSLVVQDGNHAHAADNVTLSTTGDLGVQEASHNLTSDNLVLTQDHTLVVADALHSHTADNIALTSVHQLALADAAHSHTVDALTLTQVHVLTVADGLHTHTADSVVLVQEHVLTVADTLHTHVADNVVLTTELVITVADSTHGHTVDALTLTQDHTLAVQDGHHAHFVYNIGLTQAHQLVVADATHSQVAENITLSTADILGVQDTLHPHHPDNVVLTQVHNLIVAEARSTHTADNIDLAQQYNLVVADALHSLTSESVTLTGGSILAINESHHALASEAVTLSQVHNLAVSDALHTLTSDVFAFFQDHTLTVEYALHDHRADNIKLNFGELPETVFTCTVWDEAPACVAVGVGR